MTDETAFTLHLGMITGGLEKPAIVTYLRSHGVTDNERGALKKALMAVAEGFYREKDKTKFCDRCGDRDPNRKNENHTFHICDDDPDFKSGEKI